MRANSGSRDTAPTTGAVAPRAAAGDHAGHAPGAAAAEHLLWAAVSTRVGLLIGLALHRLLASIPRHAAANTSTVVGALGSLLLMLISVPGGQAALGQRGPWLATLLWPLAILIGCVVIQGVPLAP